MNLKRIAVAAVASAAAAWLLAGCASSPSTGRYIAASASPSAITETPEAPSPTNARSPSEDVVETQPDASPQASPSETPKETATNAPAKKSFKPEQAKEAKKSNESVGKAVTDSILDKAAGKDASPDEDAKRLQASIDQIRQRIKALKKHADEGDAEQIKSVSALIAGDWDGMKPAVAASYPDMTDFLQEKIDLLNELQAAETIDAEAVLRLDYELYQSFRQLADKAGVQ